MAWLLVALPGCGPAPASLETLLAEARAHQEAGDRVAAVAVLEKALLEHPGSGEARARLAALRLAAGEAQAAALEFRRALRDGASEEQLSVPFATALLATGQADEALAVLAAAPVPTDAAARSARDLMRARALEAARRPEAAAAFGMLLDTAAGVDARAGLGRLALAGGREQQARNWLAQGQAIDPRAPSLLWLAGELEFRARAYERSASAYRQLVEAGASGGPIPAALGLARAQVFSGATGEAAVLLDALIAADPADVQARFYRALAAYRAGDFAAAARLGEHILAQSPGSRQAYLLLGGARAALGDANRARTYLGHYLGTDPGHRAARRLLEALEAHDAGTGAVASPALVEALFFSAD